MSKSVKRVARAAADLGLDVEIRRMGASTRTAQAAGGALSRADANEVRARTGFAIGGVSPIGHLEAPEVWMDRTLFDHATVWAAAGAPDAVFQITPTDLERAANARTADFAR